LVFTLSTLFSCKNDIQDKPSSLSKSKLLKKDSLSTEEIAKMFHIDAYEFFTGKFAVTYSYYSNSDSLIILDGPFSLSYADSGYYEDQVDKKKKLDMYWISKVNYSGQFIDNKRQGQFIENVFVDDGIDFYNNWTIKIDFTDDKCKSAIFSGAIGPSMPDTTYTLEYFDSCTFHFVNKLVWRNWEKQFDKIKNAR